MMDSPGNNSTRSFARYLSRLDVWALSLGCIIGWGAFVMPGTTFLPMAGPGGTVVAVLISAIATLVISYNYILLMTQYPGTGGVYTYSKALLGKDHAFLSAWFLCLSYLSLIPQNATMLAYICRILTGDLFTKGPHYQIAGTEIYMAEIAIIVVVLILVGLFAIRMKPFLQCIQTALGVVLAVGVLIIAIIALPHIPHSAPLTALGTEDVSPLRGIVTIVILAPWAFVGFEVVSLETAHFRFSVKRSGKLIVLAILTGGFVYAVMAITATLRQPAGCAGWQDYISQLSQHDGFAAVPTFYVMERLMGKVGLCVIALTAFAAVFTTIIGFYRACARILMNMAEDDILTERFNHPSVCFLFLTGLSVIISLFGRKAISWVVDLSSLGAIVAFGYVSVAAYRLTKQKTSARARIAGVAGIFLTIAFAAAQLVPGISVIETMKAESYLLLAIWCLIGFAFYWRTMRTDEDPERRNESVTIVAMFTLLTFSIVVWYIKKVLNSVESGASAHSLIVWSLILLLFILSGLIVMQLILAMLKQRQLKLETDRIRAVENSQAKSQFLFNMSHDIRTPMNAIIGYAQLAMKESVSPRVRDYLEKIDLSSQNMLTMINDLLEMSRIDSGNMILENAPVELPVLFEEIRRLFSGQAESKGITFSLVASEITHEWVSCDRKSLTRVLVSLLSNACKFTPPGGAIDVSLREIECGKQDRATYAIGVKDSGIGMSEEFAGKMFGAFERERTSTESGLEGTGLGLTITKSILDLMGATIDVQTSPGHGTQILIYVEFPLAQAPEAMSPDDADSPATEDAPIDFGAMRFLLVEDNLINMEIAQMILSSTGVTIETAENGQIALEKVREAAPGYYDAILMDIQMPVMDGYTATRSIRALPDSRKAVVPIIAMTANAFREDEEAAFAAGMQAHIAKPIDVNIMLETINRVVREARIKGRNTTT